MAAAASTATLATTTTIAADVRQIPSVQNIKSWMSNFARKNDMNWDAVNGKPYDFVKPEIIDWFITTQHDAWVMSGRPFTTYQELVFGVPNTDYYKRTAISSSLHYYYNDRYGVCDFHRKSPFWIYRDIPDMPESYNKNIRKCFPGIPSHFIAVSHKYFIATGSRFTNFPFVLMSRDALIVFLMVCNRIDLPTEIIHLILLNLGVNIFTGKSSTGKDIKFLESSDDFKKALRFFTHDISNEHYREIGVSYITQMIDCFSR